jgi:hypothetical protein
MPQNGAKVEILILFLKNRKKKLFKAPITIPLGELESQGKI